MKRIRVDNDVFCALKVHSNHVRNFLGENPFTLPAGPGFGGDLPPWREVGDACYGCICRLYYPLLELRLWVVLVQVILRWYLRNPVDLIQVMLYKMMEIHLFQ